MDTRNRLQTGYGVEMEGFIVTEDGMPVALTYSGQPLIEWLQMRWAMEQPGAADLVSAEQLAHMVEIKSTIVGKRKQGLEMVKSIREQLNRLLEQGALRGEIRSGLRIVFVPVLDKKTDLIAASTDKQSRSYKLVEAWSSTPEGMERLYDTAIASCQLNDSRVFAGLDPDQSWDVLLALYNHYSYEELMKLMRKFNKSSAVNHEGMTRRECLERLLPGVKGEQFLARGYAKRHVIYPPRFTVRRDAELWYCAHSNVASFAEAECKDAHGIALKGKLDDLNNPHIVETRWIDATESDEQALGAMDAVTAINWSIRERVLKRAA